VGRMDVSLAKHELATILKPSRSHAHTVAIQPGVSVSMRDRVQLDKFIATARSAGELVDPR
jgi:hypothetical protein